MSYYSTFYIYHTSTPSEMACTIFGTYDATCSKVFPAAIKKT